MKKNVGWLALVFALVVIIGGAPAVARTVVDVARNARNFAHYTIDRFPLTCHPGTISGMAEVRSDFSSDWGATNGYSFTRGIGGPYPAHGAPRDFCSTDTPEARHVSPGTYEVALWPSTGAQPQSDCDVAAGELHPATVTVSDARPLVATYESFCSEKGRITRVHISDLSGTPTDAGFTVVAYEPPTLLYP